MNAGDDIRKNCGRGDALAILAVSEIRERRDKTHQRRKDDRASPGKFEKKAYLLDSLKHPDEVKTLRAVYGQGFLLLSGYSRREERTSNLARRIARSNSDPQGIDKFRSHAEKIIRRDYDDENSQYGQKVRSCFSRADFFIDLDSPKGQQSSYIGRYLEIVFNNPLRTPTKDEAGMFHAEAASWRSADLSRQVGSAICTPSGEILSVGCNEAPKAFGGLYWEGDHNDGRDFQREHNEGSEQKRLLVAEIFERLSQDSSFDDQAKGRIKDLQEKVTAGESDSALDDLQALNVIEYGRTVHAEMAALSDAAARGVSVSGATMYVNTFPCHICARHIVASGIRRLVYVEPYPKSLTGRLFDDSVALEPLSDVSDRVIFEAFTGIAPRAYRFSFALQGNRKDESGNAFRWRKASASTKMKRYIASYQAIEAHVTAFLLPSVAGSSIPECSDVGDRIAKAKRDLQSYPEAITENCTFQGGPTYSSPGDTQEDANEEPSPGG